MAEYTEVSDVEDIFAKSGSEDECYMDSNASSDEETLPTSDDEAEEGHILDSDLPLNEEQIQNRENWSFQANFVPKQFKFDDTDCGLNANIAFGNDAAEMDFFKLFFDDSLMSLIVEESNRYARNLKQERASFSSWEDVNINELYTFFSLCILMGVVEKPKVKDYWSSNPLHHTPFFPKVMSRDRFLQLMAGLHFVDNNNHSAVEDSLWKIRPIVDGIQTRFSSSFYPFQDVAIDESIAVWKGRLKFKQYIPTKRHRVGVKLFEVCDAETGYVLNYIIYTGSSMPVKCCDLPGVTGNIVLSLMEKYLNTGHILYVDNYFSSPDLFTYLWEHNTGACGSVLPRRKGMPLFHHLRQGEHEKAHNGRLLAMKMSDKKNVHMLTSVHTAEYADSGKTCRISGEKIMKPNCIIEYNNKMGSVDKADMQISFVDCARKSLKWYKKLFFHLMDLSLYNAYVLFQVKTGDKPSFSDFRIKIVTQLVEIHSVPRIPRARPPTVHSPLRLSGRHFPVPIPRTAAQGNRTQRRCHVCNTTTLSNRARVDVRFMCKECAVPLCVYPCFGKFHTRKVY